MNLFLNGRKVSDYAVEVDSFRGFDDCEAWFCSATFEDTGAALTVDELERLSDLYPEILAEAAYDSAVCSADFMD